MQSFGYINFVVASTPAEEYSSLPAAPPHSSNDLKSSSLPLNTRMQLGTALGALSLQTTPAQTLGTSTTAVSTAPSQASARNASVPPGFALENLQQNSTGASVNNAPVGEPVSQPQLTQTARLATPGDTSATTRSSQPATPPPAAAAAATLTVERNLNIDVPNPKYPDYRQLGNRVESFRRHNWDQRRAQTPDVMAEAGFFSVGKLLKI